jgi:hypothetical protein
VAALAVFGVAIGCHSNGPATIPPPAATESTPRAAADLASALHAALGERLGVETELVVRGECRIDAWTFLCGRPVTPTGSRIDFATTKLRTSADEGIVDYNACALLEQTAAGYVVWELAVGDTDAPFVDWPARHGIPASIISIERCPVSSIDGEEPTRVR